MPRTLPSIQKLITILNEAQPSSCEASPAEQALAVVRFQALETADSSRAVSTDRKAVQAGGLRFRARTAAVPTTARSSRIGRVHDPGRQFWQRCRWLRCWVVSLTGKLCGSRHS